MAVRVVEGIIGSGKSYFVVWHIADTYFDYNDVTNTWKPKKEGLTVYSNVDCFALAHPLQPCIDDAGGLDKFFSKNYQKTFIGDRDIIYIIDEAQGPDFFHRKFYDPDVTYFFQYSRHFGVDVYLLTQDVKNLAREFRDMAEYHVIATQRSKSMGGEFRYSFMVGGQKWKSKTLWPNLKYFSIYKSMNKKEIEKIKSAPARYAVIFVFLFALAFIVFYWGLIGYFFQSDKSVVDSTAVAFSVPESPLSASIKATPVETSKQIDIVAESMPSEEFIEVTITAMLIVSDSNVSLILFEDSKGREFKMTLFEFDRLCKCSSFDRLRAGDTVQVLKPPVGTRFIRREIKSSTSTF